MSNFPVGFKPPKRAPAKEKLQKGPPREGSFLGIFGAFWEMGEMTIQPENDKLSSSPSNVETYTDGFGRCPFPCKDVCDSKARL